MGTSVVVGVYATPVLDAPEGVVDLVPRSMERLVVVDLDRSIGSRRDAGRYAVSDQRSAEPVGFIAPVAQQGFGFGKGVDHQGRALVVAHKGSSSRARVLISSSFIRHWDGTKSVHLREP